MIEKNHMIVTLDNTGHKSETFYETEAKAMVRFNKDLERRRAWGFVSIIRYNAEGRTQEYWAGK